MTNGEIDKAHDLLKKDLWKYTNSKDVVEELFSYSSNVFPKLQGKIKLPLSDESHIPAWKFYKKNSENNFLLDELKSVFPSLNFPIKKGINTSEDYDKAVFKGHSVQNLAEATGLDLIQPNDIHLQFIEGLVGRIPAIIVENFQDFESLIQALVYKNQPREIPPAMGASLIKGLNNRHRLKNALIDLENRIISSKNDQRKEILSNKSLYQDTIIIASKNPYSNVYPSGYSKPEWIEDSLSLRLNHEYAHYATLRLFGIIRSNLHDEILADFLGIVGIKGNFKADLFLHFLGLEQYPKYRKGGRMENYTKNISFEGFEVLKTMIYRAAHNIEKYDQSIQSENFKHKAFFQMLTLSQLSIIELAKDNSILVLKKNYFELVDKFYNQV